MDTSLFIYSSKGVYILHLIYVDDIFITVSHDNSIAKLISDLHAKFALKQVGSLHYFPGVQIVRNSFGLYLSRGKYVAYLLAKLNMIGRKQCSSHAPSRQVLSKDGGEAMENPFLYRSTIGALQYLTYIGLLVKEYSFISKEKSLKAFLFVSHHNSALLASPTQIGPTMLMTNDPLVHIVSTY